MSEDKKTDHEYDGIRENDNPAPMWWQTLFYVSIVFSIAYAVYYHIGNGPSLQQEFEQDQTELAILKQKQQTQGPSTAELKAIAADPKQVAAGKVMFGAKCASCHGPEAGGLVGPNLTDNAWIHGNGDVDSIYLSVTQGYPEKGMPPWGAVLKQEEIKAIVGFIRSIRGTHPSNPKAAQGEVRGDSS